MGIWNYSSSEDTQ